MTGPVARPPRIVSLVPSVTETLLAWGVEPVACTRFCEQPGLLHVGGTKDPDIAAIRSLRPDVVVVGNAVLQMPIGWWRKRVQSRFQVVYEHNLRDLECVFLGEPLAR